VLHNKSPQTQCQSKSCLFCSWVCVIVCATWLSRASSLCGYRLAVDWKLKLLISSLSAGELVLSCFLSRLALAYFHGNGKGARGTCSKVWVPFRPCLSHLPAFPSLESVGRPRVW
jgi:hypothetical protein